MNDLKSIIYRLLYNDRILKYNKQYERLFDVCWNNGNFEALSCKNPYIPESCNYRINDFLSYVDIYSLYSLYKIVGKLPNNY